MYALIFHRIGIPNTIYFNGSNAMVKTLKIYLHWTVLPPF